MMVVMVMRRRRTGAEKNSTAAVVTVVTYLGKSKSLRRRFGLEAGGVNLRPAGIIHWREVWHDLRLKYELRTFAADLERSGSKNGCRGH